MCTNNISVAFLASSNNPTVTEISSCIPSYLKTKPELIGLPLACKWYHISCHTIAVSQIGEGGKVNPNMT